MSSFTVLAKKNTPDRLRKAAGEGKILHAPQDGPQPSLLDIPMLPGNEIFPNLRLLIAASPEEIQVTLKSFIDDKDQERCQQVWEQLTPREKEVLRLLAQGDTPQEVAGKLHLGITTVSSHQRNIYANCRTEWSMQDGTSLDYRWLQQKFGRWRGLDSQA